jgi:magnesium-transporting ATPase (P-type)
MANYLQLLSATLSFNMKYPQILVDMFYPIQRIGASSEAFLSFDWFVRDSEIKAFTPSAAFLKVFLTGMLPLFLIAVCSLGWTILYFIYKKWFGNIKRNIVVTIVVIVFLLHPTVTNVSLELFQCVELDNKIFKVRIDLDVDCYSVEHLFWWAVFRKNDYPLLPSG